MPERFLTLVVAICLVLLASGRAEAAPVVDGEFDVTGLPQRIAQGPDGNMWVTVASAVGVSADDLRELNPHLIQSRTPPGKPFIIRIPEGRAARFAATCCTRSR